jgi:hypothetical protein
MADIDCFQEEAGCLERLWHITKKHSLMIKVGEILSNKLKNHKASLFAYNSYFLASNPKFYNVYSQNIKELTQNLNFQTNIDDFALPIIKLADKYNLLVYIFKYANHIKNYSFILKKSSKLDEIEKKALEIFDENSQVDNAYMNEIKGAKKHFSTIISTVNDNLGLNILALNNNPQNLKAHINILNIYTSEKNYDEALKTYIAHAKRTGNYGITDIVKLAGLKSPFENGACSEVASFCEELLNKLA